MKNAFLFILFMMLLMSCDNTPVYTVTVVGISHEKVLDPSVIYTASVYNVVTVSGDTVVCAVDDAVRLNNKLPYKAMMKKIAGRKYGRVFKTAITERK